MLKRSCKTGTRAQSPLLRHTGSSRRSTNQRRGSRAASQSATSWRLGATELRGSAVARQRLSNTVPRIDRLSGWGRFQPRKCGLRAVLSKNCTETGVAENFARFSKIFVGNLAIKLSEVEASPKPPSFDAQVSLWVQHNYIFKILLCHELFYSIFFKFNSLLSKSRQNRRNLTIPSWNK